MTDLTLHPSFTHTTDSMWERSLHLQFNNIYNPESITAITNVMGSTITLTNCSIKGLTLFNADGKLTLRDIEADQNLPPLLYAWEGDSLQVINCPSFNDAVLDIMGDYDYDNACFFGASRASSLEIHDCLHFSGAALRCLVATRLNRDEFTTVEVSGHAPEITAEDVEWLSQNVNWFVYNPSRS
jgi:hypothetical protein